MSVHPGDAFLGDPRQLAAQTRHLWIVVHVHESGLDTCALAVLVSATSWIPGGDTSCALDVGDHPFIAYRSFVYYQMAVEIPVTDVEQNMQRYAAVSPAVLTRLRQGLHASRFTPRGLKRKVPRA